MSDNNNTKADAEAEAASKHINNSLGGATEAINAYLKMLDKGLSSLIPEGTTKNVTLQITPDTERVIKKGFFGIGRKVEIIPGKSVKANVYIAMNNVLVIDIPNKTELKAYYESLK